MTSSKTYTFVLNGEPMDIKAGELIELGNKVYGLCPDCENLIRIDKPILGSFHFCRD